jgi:hypothetical protein
LDGGGWILGCGTTGQGAGNTVYQSIFGQTSSAIGESKHRAAMPAGKLKWMFVRILTGQPNLLPGG